MAMPALITAQQVAEVAMVGSSAVSNWRQRKADFPTPDSSGLFDRDEIIRWLKANGRPVKEFGDSTGTRLWKVLDYLRGTGLNEAVGVELILQLLTLRAAALDNSSARLAALSGAWGELRDSTWPQREWRNVVSKHANEDPDVERALQPQAEKLEEMVLVEIMTQTDYYESFEDCGTAARLLVDRWMETSGNRSGELASSPALSSIVVEVLKPISGTVYDPAAGAAAMLREAARSADGPVRLFGQELSEHSWRIGMLLLLLSESDFELRAGDTLRFDEFPDLLADRIVADPPWGLRNVHEVPPGVDARWPDGVSRRESSDSLWIRHCIHHLAADGVAAVVTLAGLLFQERELRFREWLTASGHLQAVISLPSGMAFGTALPPVLLLLGRRPHTTNKTVLFMDASESEIGTRTRASQIDRVQLDRIRATLDSWTAGTLVDAHDFARSVAVNEIADQGFDLSPQRYITASNETPTIDGEELPARLQRLAPTLGSTATDVADATARLALLAPSFEAIAVDRKTVLLGDVLAEQPTPGRRQTENDAGDALPWVPNSALGRTITERPAETTGDDFGDRAAQRGDVLLAEIPDSSGIFKTSLIEFDGPVGYSKSAIRLRPVPELVDARFLATYLRSKAGAAELSRITRGTTIQRIDRKALFDLSVNLPALADQRRLTDALEQFEAQEAKLGSAVRVAQDFAETIAEGISAGMVDFNNNHGKNS